MSRLDSETEVFRSKNAGPFLITVDIVFADQSRYEAVERSGVLNTRSIARRYGIDARQVRVHFVDRIRTVKITVPRNSASAGAPGDTDVYGAQQHGPLLDLEIPDDPAAGTTE